ncbi:hypothetical protein DPMN_027945 [Dreissena polymorpha]|uniref:Uncharacterized protein n=1 Tax=Dreissena polymorpha TaxID=45954 RepID=A0A9D4LWA1_DREPO|nr:hypothetical protein DPMN_027945 [Dreissena polymorpha]
METTQSNFHRRSGILYDSRQKSHGGLRLQNEQQITLGLTITYLIKEGLRIVLRLKKLIQAIVSYPEPQRWCCKRRPELGILHLAWLNRDPEFRDERFVINESYSVLREIMVRQTEIVREILDRIFMEGISVKDGTSINVRMLRMLCM